MAKKIIGWTREITLWALLFALGGLAMGIGFGLGAELAGATVVIVR